ncbi:uncharacterized protein T069G_11137 [Trichoderma breve]|uniref:Uncharacterized protein n=1 Tax=Trichoderma breve TaxID=2034170 RepID=A0A9W9B627_9HYPO|nr:uncharacterized protein T069G_11137 [Trichoderma breve]KAJ4854158.1 hypothetical protein T069G_11137 [Trichoderma breve]
MNFLTEALKPIHVVVWGGPALEHYGVQAFIYGYIFIVNECDRDLAAAKLLDAGCIRADWSWGSTGPATLQTLDDNAQRIHKKSIPEYEDIDNNSICFVFPPERVSIMNEPIALVLPSFVGLGPPRTAVLGSREPAQSETQNDENSTRLHKSPQAEALVQREDILQEYTAQEVTSLAATPQMDIPQEGKHQEDKLQEDKPEEAATLLESQTLPEQEPYPEPESLQPIKSQQNSELLQDVKHIPDIGKLQGGDIILENTADDSKFTCVDGFLYYPRLPILLETIIRARLRVPEEKVSYWATMLEVWAIPYLWAQAMAPYDILDEIEDKEVKTWFNKATKRFEGGIDRVTNTKRKGRVPSTRPPVDLDALFD